MITSWKHEEESALLFSSMRSTSSWRLPCLLTILAFFLLFPGIGIGVLRNYDDCYYAQKAKELLETGDLITIRYAGAPRFDNPPMFIWMIAVAFKLFGISKFSAILFSSLAGLVTVLLTYRIALYFFAPHLAFLSSSLLLATPYFMRHARRAMVDVPLAMFYVLAIAAFLEAVRRKEEGKKAHWFLLSGSAVGGAILTKSLVGALPLLVMLLFLLFSGRWRMVYDPYCVGGVLLALLVPLVWYAPEYSIYGLQFFDAHFGELIWKRAVVGRYEYHWYVHLGYLSDLLREAWPGVPLFLGGIVYHGRRILRQRNDLGRRSSNPFSKRDGSLIVLLWTLVVLVALSAAKERMLRYLIPAFPAMAMAGATALDPFLANERRIALALRYTVLFLGLAALIVVLLPDKLSQNRKSHIYELAHVAAEVVPKGETVLNLNISYWSVSNIFLFYSDRKITYPIRDEEEFVKRLEGGHYGLISMDDYRRLFAHRERSYPIVAECEGMILFKEGDPVHSVLGRRG